MSSRNTDTRIYREELCPWLPDAIIDCHVHVALDNHWKPISAERRKELWAIEAGGSQSWEQLRSNRQLLFPDRQVAVLAFGHVFREVDIEKNNQYVLDGLSDPQNNARGLFVTRPEYAPEVIEQAMAKGFIGVKPYPDLAPQGKESIFDFITNAHLEVLDRLGGILMLHLPRTGRLADPDNIREVLELADSYPRVKLIIAHIGRAYCLPNAEKGLPAFVDKPHIYFDTAANLNADVFQYALETIGPDRILYGSDLPVTLMRGMREHVGDHYINYTDGSYSWNINRKSPEEESQYTWFLYQELRAIITAAQRSGFSKLEMTRIMYSNSAGLLGYQSETSKR